MADNEEEGEWSPWEKDVEAVEEEEEGDSEHPEHQPLIVSVPQPLQSQERLDMDGSSGSLHLVGKPPSVRLQYVSAIIASLGAFTMGCVIGYSSPAGIMLTKNSTMANSTDNPLVLTADQNNWFGSSMPLGALLGGPVCGICLTTIGRKGTMQASALPFVGAWLIIAFARNFLMLMVGRILTGFCCGITCMVVNTYIAEIASANIRGTLGAGFQLQVTLGVLYAMTIGAFVSSWQLLAGLCAIPPLLYFVLLFFVKESPTFLLSKGKDEQAAASLQFLRGQHYNIQTEMDMLRESLEDAKQNKASFRDLLVPHNLKPLLISITLMFFQQFSGINPVLFNLATIFEDAGSSLKPQYSSIIIAVVQVASTFFAVILMDRAGRKFLLIASSSVMALSLVALGEFFYLKSEDAEWADNTLGFLPLVSLIVYILAFSYGYGPIPWLMMGELFASNVKERAASVATVCNWTLSFTVTVIFLPLKNSIDDYGVYWLYSAICVLNLVFCVWIVPETKGKTLEEITVYFGGPATGSSIRRRRSEL